MRHRICHCISNKQIFSATATELDFVFCNKTTRKISKTIKNQLTLNFFALVSSLYSYFQLSKNGFYIYGIRHTRNLQIKFLTR